MRSEWLGLGRVISQLSRIWDLRSVIALSKALEYTN